MTDDMPLQHVIRPKLPWRDEQLTECRKPPNEHAITRDQFIAKVRKLGKKRAAMTTCMTCFDTAERWPDWNTNPVAVLARDVRGVTYWGGVDHEAPLRDELRAIALLIEAHQEEFAQTLAALKNTVPFGKRKPRAVRRG
ncbi:hypothetical protein [Nonomuraea wenchangensis]|uniref:Uncharacterized protein n=1 Tax=Nonomuraea wenchangensis TaxID=568860 RepID=A0A1I0LTJ6_9ACTN|nr:hypothetical protein [Nonomuraea wenchangensis]SEU46446.1 hypothetical protein SAMN05421811_12737 [Nonomuraea wenchangensis]